MAASSNISEATEKSIPNWKVTGDWFDVGPMTPAGKRVQTINAPGSEVGPWQSCNMGKGYY